MKLSLALVIFAALMFAGVPGISVRGKLIQGPSLELTGHKILHLHGDDGTMGILNDKRLEDADLEAVGHFTAPDQFEIDPIHTSAMFVHKDGKRLVITYWCDICFIRTYTPGVCVCCQKWTDLDLRDPDDPKP